MRKYGVALIALAALSNNVSAQDSKHFDGAYVGGEIGYLDADSNVSGIYYGGTIGLRKQFDNNVVFGIEGNLGSSNADFRNFNNVIDRQTSVLATYGLAFGSQKRDLISAGVGYINTNVSFDDFDGSSGAIASFIGYERALGSKLSVRFRITAYEGFDAFNGTGGLVFRF